MHRWVREKLGGQYHQQNRIYEMGDLALCLQAQIPNGSYWYLEIKEMDIKVLGDIYEDNGYGSQGGRVYDTEGIVAALGASHFQQEKYILEKQIVAMRGRSGGQELEVQKEELTNTITTVQKDNLVMETILNKVYVKQATKDGYIPCEVGGVADLNYPDSKTRRGRVQGEGQICPTLTTENIPNVLEDWLWEVDGFTYLIRIRKLTPRECWRLMSFSDEDYEKAAEVNSQTQLYKQAGNSIVKDVLVAVLGQLFED